jgi:hypothetical protein
VSARTPLFPTMGCCPGCGKVRFIKRSDAKRARRLHHPGAQVYPCGGFYHVGYPTLPRALSDDGEPACRTPGKPHHPTEDDAQADAEARLRRGKLTPGYRIYECACGNGYCVARPHRDNTWRANA